MKSYTKIFSVTAALVTAEEIESELNMPPMVIT